MKSQEQQHGSGIIRITLLAGSIAFILLGSAELLVLFLTGNSFEKAQDLCCVALLMVFFGSLVCKFRDHLNLQIFSILNSFSPFLKDIRAYFNDFLKKEEPLHLYTLALIIILASGLRIFYLFQPMRYDEAFTFVYYVSKPFLTGMSDYSYPNNHIFHTLLARVSYLILGNHPPVIRLPAFLAGILLVPASYIVTRIFYNKYAALLTAGLVASSSLLVEFSANARGYTMICLFFLITMALASYLMKNKSSYGWFLFSLFSALGFYTVPIMLYPFGIIAAWLLVSILFQNTHLSRKYLLKEFFTSILIMSLMIIILYTPVILESGLKSLLFNKFVESKDYLYFFRNITPSLLAIWREWNRDIPFVITLIFLSGFFFSLIFHGKISSWRFSVATGVIIWLVPIVIIQRVIPPERTLLFLLPLYAGMSVSGLYYLVKSIRPVICNYQSVISVILTVILSLFLSANILYRDSIYLSNPDREDESVALFLKDYLEPGDYIITQEYSSTLNYYFDFYCISLDYLGKNRLNPGRILVMVYKSRNQTLEEIQNNKMNASVIGDITVKTVSSVISDRRKLEVINKLKGYIISKEKLGKALKKLDFTGDEIKLILSACEDVCLMDYLDEPEEVKEFETAIIYKIDLTDL